jgi:hypothetical protein
MWTSGSLAAIGNTKILSIVGPSDMLQYPAPRHRSLESFFTNYFAEYVVPNLMKRVNAYTKSAADQQAEDSTLLEGQLQNLEELGLLLV